MPKPPLMPDQSILERDVIETLLAGLKQWRPDLNYPESHSDMQGCVRALLTMFEVKRRPLPEPLASPCPDCDGLGHMVTHVDAGSRSLETCKRCRYGKVYY